MRTVKCQGQMQRAMLYIGVLRLGEEGMKRAEINILMKQWGNEN